MTIADDRPAQIAAGGTFSRLAATMSQPAFAEYPERPVKIVLPLGPGGVGDISARIVADKLGEKLGQRFIIENMPGVAGIAASRSVVAAPADGYTLLLNTGGIASSIPLFNKFPVDVLNDLTPSILDRLLRLPARDQQPVRLQDARRFHSGREGQPGQTQHRHH